MEHWKLEGMQTQVSSYIVIPSGGILTCLIKVMQHVHFLKTCHGSIKIRWPLHIAVTNAYETRWSDIKQPSYILPDSIIFATAAI